MKHEALNNQDMSTCNKITTNGWVSVTDALPKPLQTVWLTNGK